MLDYDAGARLVRVKDGLLAEGWYVFDSGMLIMQSPSVRRFP